MPQNAYDIFVGKDIEQKPDRFYLDELGEILLEDEDIMSWVASTTINDPEFAIVVLKSKKLREYVPEEQEYTLAHFAVFKHEKAARYAMEDPEIYEIRTSNGETVAYTAIKTHGVVASSVRHDERVRSLVTSKGRQLGAVMDRL